MMPFNQSSQGEMSRQAPIMFLFTKNILFLDQQDLSALTLILMKTRFITAMLFWMLYTRLLTVQHTDLAVQTK